MGPAYKRVPTFLANLPLRLVPFTAKQQAIYDQTGFVADVAFKTTPKAGKVLLPLYTLVKQKHMFHTRNGSQRYTFCYDRTAALLLPCKVSPCASGNVQIEIKQFLERVYGLDVVSVRTANFEGSKHRGKTGHHYRRADWKKAHVTLRPPTSTT